MKSRFLKSMAIVTKNKKIQNKAKSGRQIETEMTLPAYQVGN